MLLLSGAPSSLTGLLVLMTLELDKESCQRDGGCSCFMLRIHCSVRRELSDVTEPFFYVVRRILRQIFVLKNANCSLRIQARTIVVV